MWIQDIIRKALPNWNPVSLTMPNTKLEKSIKAIFAKLSACCLAFFVHWFKSSSSNCGSLCLRVEELSLSDSLSEADCCCDCLSDTRNAKDAPEVPNFLCATFHSVALINSIPLPIQILLFGCLILRSRGWCCFIIVKLPII